MSLAITPNLIPLNPGDTQTITVNPGIGFAGTAAGVTAASNNVNAATVAGGGASFPLTFVVTAPASAYGTAVITFTTNNSTNSADSGDGVACPVIPQNNYVPQGRSAAQLIATVQRRTNLGFGLPIPTDVLAMINDGVEYVAGFLESILVTLPIQIVTPNTNIIALPEDLERIRDMNFSTGNPAVAGTVVYEMVQKEYDEFIQETDSTPAGGIGGIPTIFTIIQDFGGFQGTGPGCQVIQIYPFANAGQINLHYWKRPLLYQNTGVSYTDLDSLYQEAVILYACMQACENREDLGAGAAYFGKKLDAEMERAKTEVKLRARKPGAGQVRDVSQGASVVPIWMR